MPNLDGLLDLLNTGAAGVLSLAFMLLLWLLWRKGETDNKAIDALADKGENVECLMSVVKCNTQAMTSIKTAVSENSRVVEKFNSDMVNRSVEMSRDIRELRQMRGG